MSNSSFSDWIGYPGVLKSSPGELLEQHLETIPTVGAVCCMSDLNGPWVLIRLYGTTIKLRPEVAKELAEILFRKAEALEERRKDENS
jgi:hypothetical protein